LSSAARPPKYLLTPFTSSIDICPLSFTSV
jgi:hypothetical protein